MPKLRVKSCDVLLRWVIEEYGNPMVPSPVAPTRKTLCDQLLALRR
jgi:hypothetical protein